MTRIAKAGFWLLLDNGERVRYEKGDMIAGPHAGHWYAIENSNEPVAGKPAPAPLNKAVEPTPAPAETPAPTPAPEPEKAESSDEDEKEALVVKAKALGIKVDARWGVARLRQEILEAETD